MKRLLQVAFVILPMALIARAGDPFGQLYLRPIGNDEVVEGLTSDDMNTRRQTRRLWGQTRDQQVDGLIGLAARDGGADGDATRRLAVEMLGEIRDPMAADVLAANIEYESGPRREGFPLAPYPAASALRKMGLTGVREILWYLRKANVSDEAIALFAQVVDSVYREEKYGGFSEAIITVDRFTARTPEHMRENLHQLRKRMQQLHQ